VVPSGKKVVYYHAYDQNGKRLFGKSTEQKTITAARVVCNRLLKKGKLTPDKNYMPIFAEYASGWWKWDAHEYLANLEIRTQGNTCPYLHNVKFAFIVDVP